MRSHRSPRGHPDTTRTWSPRNGRGAGPSADADRAAVRSWSASSGRGSGAVSRSDPRKPRPGSDANTALTGAVFRCTSRRFPCRGPKLQPPAGTVHVAPMLVQSNRPCRTAVVIGVAELLDVAEAGDLVGKAASVEGATVIEAELGGPARLIGGEHALDEARRETVPLHIGDEANAVAHLVGPEGDSTARDVAAELDGLHGEAVSRVA